MFQMAVHCTIGLLFLGGGRATLSTTPTAVAALLAAFFPKFPTHSEDNRLVYSLLTLATIQNAIFSLLGLCVLNSLRYKILLRLRVRLVEKGIWIIKRVRLW